LKEQEMNFVKTLVAAAAVAASCGANALVTGTLGGGAGTLAVLSSPTLGVAGTGGSLSGAVSATIVGGAVYAIDMSFADDVLPGENFLAAGPTAGGFPPAAPANTATLTFAGAGVSYVSFLWGSPDTYNTLTVNSTGGDSQTFTATGTGFGVPFLVTNGDQSPASNQSVQFSGIGASLITSLVFTSTQDSFEASRVTAQSPTPDQQAVIPEPETYVLMLAGLGALGFMAGRRRWY
jgi:hypothetical protein